MAKYGSVENVAAEAARRAEDRASKKRKREADKASAGAERDQARVLHMSVLRSLLEARAFPPGVVAWLLETPEAVTWARRKTFNPEPTQMRAAAAVVVEQLIKFQAEAETRRTDLLQTIRQRLVAAERQRCDRTKPRPTRPPTHHHDGTRHSPTTANPTPTSRARHHTSTPTPTPTPTPTV